MKVSHGGKTQSWSGFPLPSYTFYLILFGFFFMLGMCTGGFTGFFFPPCLTRSVHLQFACCHGAVVNKADQMQKTDGLQCDEAGGK